MKPRVILFDLDGTLTDSAPGIVRCVEESLKPFGLTVDPAVVTGFIGPPLTWSYPHYCGLSAEDTMRAVALFQARYAEVGKFENSVYEGIPETLAALRARGYVLGVATSKPEVFAKEIIGHFALGGYFDVIAGGLLSEGGTKADVIRAALATLGAEPEETAMVGDRRHDMIGAREVGTTGVGALWGFGDERELTESGAVALAATPTDLLRIFE